MKHPLIELLEDGAVSESRLSGVAMQLLGPLRETKVVVRERVGHGWKWVLKNPATLRAAIENAWPGLLQAPDPSQGPRMQAIAKRRSAHASRRAEIQPVLVKGRIGLWLDGPRGQRFEVGEVTRAAGVIAFMLDDQAGWSFSGPKTLTLATIENLENFVRAEAIGVHADIWIYTQGRLSGRIFHWLSSLAHSANCLIHLGDYDPVGVDEYRKLRVSWGDRCSMHVPDDLEDLFKHYSDRGIMEKEANQKVFGKLLEKASDLPLDAQKVIQLIRTYGAGLEQEVLSKN